MGNLAALDMVEQGGVNDATLSWHLFSNHYPPLPQGSVEVAKKVIDILSSGLDTFVDMTGVAEHRVYGTFVPASVIAEAWHLWPFIEQENDYITDEDLVGGTE